MARRMAERDVRFVQLFHRGWDHHRSVTGDLPAQCKDVDQPQAAWLAGGGIRPGITFGETDEFSYNVVKGAVSAHDLHATMLHCLGIDHTRLTFQAQGLDFRLTGVEPSRVIDEILA